MASGLSSINIATDNPAVAAEYAPCLNRLCDNNDTLTTARQALLGLIGIYGVIRQQEALEDQIALQERVVDQADEYLALATRNYEEVVLRTFNDVTLPAYNNIAQPAFDCQKALFDRYNDEFRPFEAAFIAITDDLPTEYEADYATAEGRAMSTVNGQIDRARQNLSRTRGKYETGRCCAEDVWFSLAAASARTAAANEGYRYEDARKLQLDRWYFSRHAAGADLAAAARANVISGVNGGVAGVNSSIAAITAGVNAATNSISSIGGAVGRLQGSANSLGGALQNQGSSFATLSNGAFQALGYQLGFGGGAQNGALSLLSSGSNAGVNAFAGGQTSTPFGGYAPYEPAGSGFFNQSFTAPSGGTGGGTIAGVF